MSKDFSFTGIAIFIIPSVLLIYRFDSCFSIASSWSCKKFFCSLSKSFCVVGIYPKPLVQLRRLQASPIQGPKPLPVIGPATIGPVPSLLGKITPPYSL